MQSARHCGNHGTDFQGSASAGAVLWDQLVSQQAREGAFDPVVNRTPAEAAEMRKLPLPPNLESYAAALTRDKLDENVIYSGHRYKRSRH
jgi:hypothetical protein